jgi:hypothetical protein
MPDLDSGHIFLTTLAPIKGAELVEKSHTSFEQNVHIALAELPTAMQSPATQKTGINSPFARNKRTHLARMFVLGDVVYNGRVGSDAIINTIRDINTINPQKVDRLNASYLVFCADIDAVTEDGAALPANLSARQQADVRASYARELWNTMGPELNDIYSNCVGFEGVQSADQFAAYLEKCHVETTMPFHDYYLELPKFNDLPVKTLIGIVAIPAVVALLGLIFRLFGAWTLPIVGWSSIWTFVIGAILAVLAGIFAVKYAIYNGTKPLAPGKYDDLPSVLKSLYLQQNFANFAVDHQGAAADRLYEDFGSFLKTHKPENKMSPTQNPGVISIAAKGGVSN